jgi:hypothetical protein
MSHDEMNEMEEEQMNQEPVEDPELEALKAQADQMNISYHPNIGIPKLKQKILHYLREQQTALQDEVVNLTEEDLSALAINAVTAHTKGLAPATREETFAYRRKTASRLIRIRVTNMNPNKKSWPGEIISVGSAKLGTFKKYVPYNVADGWHVPTIIYEAMKDRMCTIFYEGKDDKGRKVKRTRRVPEFSIEVMPPLASAELKDLADRQAKSFTIDN